MKVAVYTAIICLLAPFISAIPTGQQPSSHLNQKHKPAPGVPVLPPKKVTSKSSSKLPTGSKK